MVLDFGKYKIVTDDRQFIVQEKRVVQEGQFTKEENIGKEYEVDLGYYSNLNSALNSLPKRILLTNDDLQVISRELKLIESKIKEFTKLFELDECTVGRG